MGSAQFDTDDSELIQTIKDSVKVEVLNVEPEQLLSREVHLPKLRPLAAPFTVWSLDALVEYLAKELDSDARGTCLINVAEPDKVEIVSTLFEATDRRFTSVVAKADTPTINILENYVTHGNAMIELQSLFIQEGPIEGLLQSLGNIVLDEEITLSDDGITQRIATQSGIERSFADITNPIALKPFRTFTEIDQPQTPFVLRLKKGDGLKVALFAADGGKWRNEARQAIKQYLTDAGVTAPILA